MTLSISLSRKTIIQQMDILKSSALILKVKKYIPCNGSESEVTVKKRF